MHFSAAWTAASTVYRLLYIQWESKQGNFLLVCIAKNHIVIKYLSLCIKRRIFPAYWARTWSSWPAATSNCTGVRWTASAISAFRNCSSQYLTSIQWMRSSRVWMRSSRVWMRSSWVWMRSSRVWTRSSRVWIRSSRVWMRPSRVWMRSSRVWMRSSRVWMRSSRVVRASYSQWRSRNWPGFDPSILRHSGIWGAADEAVLNIAQKNEKSKNISPLKKGKQAVHWSRKFMNVQFPWGFWT